MKPIKPIVVDVPLSEARRDRVEREVFARLDAMRDVDRVNSIAPVRKTKLPVFAAGFALVAAAASVVFFGFGAGRETPAGPSSPSLVVTPAGGSSRFTVGESVIDAGSDTSVEVKQDPKGGTTLLLARGSVDCDVTPRPNRPPFRVIAGDVTVEVVGTRFAVSRLGDVTRVDVTRGKVSVHGNGEKRLLAGGDSWSSATTTAAAPTKVIVVEVDEPEPAPAAPEIEIELPPESARPAKNEPTISPQEAYAAALQIDDEKRRMRAYKAIGGGSHSWAALSLFNLAELHAKRGNVKATLATLDDLRRRFPKHGNAEDAAWFRVEVLRDAHRITESRNAAADYLRDFPQGTYAKLAARLVRP